ncbi:YcxB family protein [Lachnoclostridium phytofermentans]|uniref:YcxB-like C-terminal domain-containing protein n=1 Tax=Lachnoclostridium phytofermentans (strain ATCC 700394 / DSM 18823 / ISDg) TaxID=357809 RepID=A9KLG7_LACP7|nr:YcxB family protein [Lachnoclostridium phytofermentans]ABX41296.1 hypothetical protein Cphy_0911 [Lachnoclostridium phytofermentans ISDg]
MFDLKYTYTKREWIRAIRRYLFLSKMISVPMVLTILFLHVVMIDLVILNKFVWLAIIVGSISFFVTVVYVYLYFIQPGYSYKKSGLEQKEIHFVFSEDKILNEHILGSSKVLWEYYHSYLESPGSFFLEVAKNQYNIIPKRVLGTKEQVNAFRVLVKKHLMESSELEREKRMKQKDKDI